MNKRRPRLRDRWLNRRSGRLAAIVGEPDERWNLVEYSYVTPIDSRRRRVTITMSLRRFHAAFNFLGTERQIGKMAVHINASRKLSTKARAALLIIVRAAYARLKGPKLADAAKEKK